jgi:hypothetical protein
MGTKSNIAETFDKNILLSAFQRAKTITEAAKMMKVSRSALRRKAIKLGLQSEYSELGKRKSQKTLPNIDSLLVSTNKDVQKPKTIQRLPQRLSSSCLVHNMKVSPNSLEEQLSLKEEIRKAKEEHRLKEEIKKGQEEQRETVNLSEKQSDDFFAELNTRLNSIMEEKNKKTKTENSEVEKKSEPTTSFLKKKIIETLLTIVPILITEYNQSEN